MEEDMRNKVSIYTLSAAFLVGGCATYESKPVPIRPASSYTLQARPQYAAAPIQPQTVPPAPAGQPLPPPSPGEGQVPPPPPGQVVPYQPSQYAGAGLSIGA